MSETALRLRPYIVTAMAEALREMGTSGWQTFPFGPDGVKAINPRPGIVTSIIVTRAEHDGAEWLHASIAHPSHDPSYAEMVFLHRIAFGQGWAYQVFAPVAAHVNIHEHALHLWGRVDGAAALPNFGEHGTI